ncbi:nuclear transport factor 2 family protein [Thalassomonas viridans]|uniref:Nuclear transport factor 2 family protein n=1 Tax=Thalassomonas viridans TaxID=137584 RepID=A0AAE9Z7J7_9GAMM|nr:nuclear transport factor 2 family protein [Thalassomonas viridans]WDE07584.1 nuclear transport factor 2 family protein [Thalassomonas viridans]
MTKDQLVQKYMDVFYRSSDFDSLHNIFSSDLKFEGPLYAFNTAKAYISSLKKSPPVNCSYEIIDEYSNEDSVCLIYHFIKGGKKTTMAQTFTIESGRIIAIRLIFNVQAIT